jgi:hypothetical protein
MAGNLTAMIAAAFSGSAAPPVTSDPYYEYTTLLLPGNGTNGAQNNTFLDSSTNNFTITRNGNTTQGTFSPFSQTGWGNYFNGSSSLATPATRQFSATGDFTISCWVYIPALSTGIIVSSWASTASDQWMLVHESNGFVFYVGTSQTLNAPNTAVTNQWMFLSVSRSGSALSMYANGSLIASNTSSATIGNPNQSILVGQRGFPGSPVYFTGYISDVRIVNGTAISGATVPTSPATAVSGTALLTCQSNRFRDASTNNFTITVNGSPSVQAFSPFNPSASWSAATYGGSGYFDGNVDYLTVPNNTAINIGTSDFQLSFWVYPTAFNTTNTIFYKASGNLVVNLLSTGQVGIAQYGAGGYAITTTNSTTLNAWAYVVVSRVSNVTKVFVNGVEGGSTGDSSNYTSTNDLLVGIDTGNTAQRYTGYLADFRLVKGSGVTSVTVPTAPLTAITNTSLLLNFTNAGIYDATSKNDLETVDGAKISTAISAKWGSGSMYFDGSGDYLNMQSSAQTQNYVFGTGDFTIETWAYFTSVASGTLFEFRPNTNGAYPLLYFSSSGVLTYFANSAAQINSSTLSTGQWYHIALARSGTSTKLFVNGTQSGSTYTDSTNYSCRTGGPLIGVTYGLSFDQLNGYLQDFRVTKGYARYTTNFTAPTAAFPTL